MHKKVHVYLIQFIILVYYNNCISGKALRSQNIRVAEFSPYTFVVPVVIRDNRYRLQENVFCTGILITVNHVLMCEHCFDSLLPGRGFKIIAGSNNINRGSSFYPNWYITYDQWAAQVNVPIGSNANDIAITKLLKDVHPTWVNGVLTDITPVQRLYGLTVRMPGWGDLLNNTSTETLRVGDVTILSSRECGARTARIRGYVVELPPTFVCSTSNPYVLMGDGDSGGPLLYGNQIVAINIGTCPKDDGTSLNTAKVNIHIAIEYFKYYIAAISCI